MNARTGFWLGAGVSIAIAAMSSSLRAQSEAPPPVETPPAVATSPAVVKPPAIAPQDLAFGRFIALIRAHLLTGDELVGRREWDLAGRHYNFPVEEI